MFSVCTTSEELKNATITSHFGFVFEENSVREITRSLLSMFFFHTNFSESPVFLNSFDLKSVLEKLYFRASSVDGSPNRKKAAFSNFSGAVWTLP